MIVRLDSSSLTLSHRITSWGLFLFIILSCTNSTKGELNTQVSTTSISPPQQLITEVELRNKTSKELRLMRNEIFARYGYIFSSHDLINYFSKRSWYKPDSRDVTEKLTEIDRINIQKLKSIEDQLSNITPELIEGQWVSKKYLDNLIETKSPRDSQSKGVVSFVEFKNTLKSSIILNFHETIDPRYSVLNNIIYFDSTYLKKSFAELLSLDKLIFEFQGEQDTLVRKLVTNENNHNVLVNEIIFEGTYHNISTGGEIEFTSNGEINGLSEFQSYVVDNDYIDAAMNIDQVRFYDFNNHLTKLSWKWASDTLTIFQQYCSKYDSLAEFCYEISKGEIMYSLKKIQK